MNRENKRKQYERGYYRNHACNEDFTCKNCGRLVVPTGAGTDHRNHCPNCLHSASGWSCVPHHQPDPEL